MTAPLERVVYFARALTAAQCLRIQHAAVSAGLDARLLRIGDPDANGEVEVTVTGTAEQYATFKRALVAAGFPRSEMPRTQ